MLAEERLSRIMKLLSQQRTATVQELCEALDASESTIRRDLNELDRMGKVNKVHGGATLPDSQFLADEPTNDLDSHWSSIVFEKLESFAHNKGHAVIAVTHDEPFATKCDVEYELDSGVLIRRR